MSKDNLPQDIPNTDATFDNALNSVPSENIALGKTLLMKILSRWYLIVLIPAVKIVYNLIVAFTTPDSSGSSILDRAEKTLTESVTDMLRMSECFAKIADFHEFSSCLGF